MSKYTNREYAGIIYKNCGGGYGYTEGRLGSGRSAPSMSETKNRMPCGVTIVGNYHTHGEYSDSAGRKTSKANDIYESDKFSRTDIDKVHLPAARSIPNFKSYLGTPSGMFYKMTDLNIIQEKF